MNLLHKAYKMGNAPSKTDIKPDQPPEDGFGKMGFPINRKIPLKGPFSIEGKKTSDGTYVFNIYRLDKSGTYTIVFSFETKIPLSNDYEILYDGTFFKFVFETDPSNNEVLYSIEYAFLFSETFEDKPDLWNRLKLMPVILHTGVQIFHLRGKYWYHLVSVSSKLHEFYIVESSDEERSRGFESTFKSGDIVVNKIIVESSNPPFIMNDEEGNFIIVSMDEGFVPIPIPIDTLLRQRFFQ